MPPIYGVNKNYISPGSLFALQSYIHLRLTPYRLPPCLCHLVAASFFRLFYPHQPIVITPLNNIVSYTVLLIKCFLRNIFIDFEYYVFGRRKSYREEIATLLKAIKTHKLILKFFLYIIARFPYNNSNRRLLRLFAGAGRKTRVLPSAGKFPATFSIGRDYMKELSVFIDESGDFGAYEHHSPFYLLTLVFHDQSVDISPNLFRLRNVMNQCGRWI